MPDTLPLDAARYRNVRAQTESLCANLEIEDYCIQAMPDVSPPKWHLAHTTWFFETFILQPYAPGYKPYYPGYVHLFNSYYETAGTFFPRPQRGLLSRPTVAEIYRYRQHVDAAMLKVIENSLASDLKDIAQRLRLGMEHEIQHQELLLMDIKYNFSINPLNVAYHSIVPAQTTQALPLEWKEFSGGIIEIGSGGAVFSYDNETPRHRTLLQDFRLATRLISNGEYLQFVEDGGYSRADLWLSDGWNTVNTQRWRAPLYWAQEEGVWWQFTLSGKLPLVLNEPVAHLSYYEADAYARWAGKRLPTEAEWEYVAASHSVAGNFLEDSLFHPAAARQSGMTQLYGDLWEWTQSAYLPYPGFRPLPGTLGEYNGKFMCDQMVLRGGCCATAKDHIRASYRNFFPARSRWMFSGLRLAEDVP